MNLVKVIRQISSDIHRLEIERDKEIEKLKVKYNNRIKDLENALEVNMELNTTCLECEGRGTVVYCGAAGHTERDTCDVCNGTGKIS